MTVREVNTYDVGQEVRSDVDFTVATVLTDPTTVTFMFLDPSGTTTTWVFGVDPEVVQDAVGRRRGANDVAGLVGALAHRREPVVACDEDCIVEGQLERHEVEMHGELRRRQRHPESAEDALNPAVERILDDKTARAQLQQLGQDNERLRQSGQDDHLLGAAGDALATVQLLEILLDHAGTMNQEDIVRHSISPNLKNLHPDLEKDSIGQLPEETGVYYFLMTRNR